MCLTSCNYKIRNVIRTCCEHLMSKPNNSVKFAFYYINLAAFHDDWQHWYRQKWFAILVPPPPWPTFWPLEALECGFEPMCWSCEFIAWLPPLGGSLIENLTLWCSDVATAAWPFDAIIWFAKSTLLKNIFTLHCNIITLVKYLNITAAYLYVDSPCCTSDQSHSDCMQIVHFTTLINNKSSLFLLWHITVNVFLKGNVS